MIFFIQAQHSSTAAAPFVLQLFASALACVFSIYCLFFPSFILSYRSKVAVPITYEVQASIRCRCCLPTLHVSSGAKSKQALGARMYSYLGGQTCPRSLVDKPHTDAAVIDAFPPVILRVRTPEIPPPTHHHPFATFSIAVPPQVPAKSKSTHTHTHAHPARKRTRNKRTTQQHETLAMHASCPMLHHALFATPRRYSLPYFNSTAVPSLKSGVKFIKYVYRLMSARAHARRTTRFICTPFPAASFVWPNSSPLAVAGSVSRVSGYAQGVRTCTTPPPVFSLEPPNFCGVSNRSRVGALDRCSVSKEIEAVAMCLPTASNH